MRFPGLFYTFLMIALCLGAPEKSATAQDQDNELVQEFERFYNPSRSTREKIEAVYVLKGYASIAATQALSKVFDDSDLAVREAAIETIGSFKEPESVQFLVDTYIMNKRERREHLIACAVECLGHMGLDAAADPLLELYGRIKSWDLKRAVAVALGRIRSEKGLPTLGLLLEDKDPTLRIVALDGMALINKPEAPITPPDDDEEPRLCKDAVIRVLNDDSDWQVRSAAIAAIRTMRFKDGVQPLIDRLREEEGRLKGDAYEALLELTFSQYEDNPDVWQQFWDRNKDEFEIPDLNAVIEARKKRAAEGTRYTLPSAEFVGIPSNSKKLIFVIDISGSMETQVTEVERFREGGKDYPSFERLGIVKKELMDTIGNFDNNVDFNILAFATNLKWWKKRLVRSNILNKNSAKDFVRRLEPIGGASAGFRARVGLKATTLEEGKTNTYGALMAALGVPEDQDNRTGKKTFKQAVDTVFFLSDGQPTVGKTVDQQEIRSAVRRVNSVRKVTIHTIAIGDFQKNFMQFLARENGGVYVDLGK